MRWLTPLLLGIAGCKGCHDLDLPDDPPPTETTDPPADSFADTTPDTDPEPPCEVPEVEPNDSFATAGVLPMEKTGCGTFLSSFDADFWDFSLDERGWVAVDVDGFLIGSEARVSLTLSSDAGVRAGVLAWNGYPEAHLKFPSDPDHFQAIVRQSVGESGQTGEGPDYFYEVRASSTKAPVVWNATESANETVGAPQRLLTGAGDARLFGGIADDADQDWYEVVLPATRYRLEAEVIAHSEGSAGDFAIELWRSGRKIGTWTSGRIGIEPDPWLQHDSLAPETLQLRVVEEDADAGAPLWYLLVLHVEAT